MPGVEARIERAIVDDEVAELDVTCAQFERAVEGFQPI